MWCYLLVLQTSCGWSLYQTQYLSLVLFGSRHGFGMIPLQVYSELSFWLQLGRYGIWRQVFVLWQQYLCFIPGTWATRMQSLCCVIQATWSNLKGPCMLECMWRECSPLLYLTSSIPLPSARGNISVGLWGHGGLSSVLGLLQQTNLKSF